MKLQKIKFFENSKISFSNKAQTGIGLVILGVVAIIAVIGLVLLFTRASTPQGAVLTELSIGNSYGGGNVPGEGIAPTYPSPTYVPGAPAIAYPSKPYPTAIMTHGSRVPVMIVSAKFGGQRTGFATIVDVNACNWALQQGPKLKQPNHQLNCYQVPNMGGSGDASGNFPTDSAAEARVPKDWRGNYGGDVYCYANSFGAEGQIPDSEDRVRENILNAVRYGSANTNGNEWTTTIANGKEVAVCGISKEAFPFPQGP